MNSIIVFTGQYLVFIIGVVALTATLLSEKTVRSKIIALAILSSLAAFGIASAAGAIYYDPRPFVVEQSTPLIPHSPDNGFPSHHTMYAMVISATVSIYSRRIGILLGISAILIGIARVIAGVHHPIDIIGGVAIAITATSIAWVVMKAVTKMRAG